MNKSRIVLAALAALACGAASAHVAFADPHAEAGKRYEGVLRVGHGCEGSPTTGVAVHLPDGVRNVQARGPNNWNVTVTPHEVTWTANAGAALPAAQPADFPLAADMPAKPGPLWFKVTQRCEKGHAEWTEVATMGASGPGIKNPAVLLQVQSPADYAFTRSLPKVEGGWVRAAVPGQSGTGAFMRITASRPMQIVGASTPVAGTAEVHEMRMEGDVMHMQAVPKLDLPAGRTVELKPGGYHVMLQDLKQPLQPGATAPLTLLLRDAQGHEGKLELQLPVAAQAPGGGGMSGMTGMDGMGGMQMHRH